MNLINKTFAAVEDTTVDQLVDKFITEILNPLITLLFVVSTVVFIWGIIMYLSGSKGDPKKLEMGKNLIFWGIIGMFIMTSVWGIIRLLCLFFGTCENVPFPGT